MKYEHLDEHMTPKCTYIYRGSFFLILKLTKIIQMIPVTNEYAPIR